MTRSKQRKIRCSMRPGVARPQARRHSLLARALPLASAIIACLNTAQAQEATASASLEEVVVTAQKRTESLQNVPLSITRVR
jgi:outer membrane receptor protein involved in Fe transport